MVEFSHTVQGNRKAERILSDISSWGCNAERGSRGEDFVRCP